MKLNIQDEEDVTAKYCDLLETAIEQTELELKEIAEKQRDLENRRTHLQRKLAVAKGEEEPSRKRGRPRQS